MQEKGQQRSDVDDADPESGGARSSSKSRRGRRKKRSERARRGVEGEVASGNRRQPSPHLLHGVHAAERASAETPWRPGGTSPPTRGRRPGSAGPRHRRRCASGRPGSAPRSPDRRRTAWRAGRLRLAGGDRDFLRPQTRPGVRSAVLAHELRRKDIGRAHECGHEARCAGRS